MTHIRPNLFAKSQDPFRQELDADVFFPGAQREEICQALILDLLTGKQLLLNYATSAAGSLQIEALDESGAVAAKSAEIYGDEFEAPLLDLSKLAGKTITLRVTMKDADIYALQFAD